MNLRFWGGWFLAIACVCIFLTMGCESGSLGVKEATVSGRVVNKDNVAMGVPNVTVRMVSKEAVSGGGELEQGYNFRSTVTDADGYFLFEKVQPDNVIFEFTAPGYKKVVFPATSDTEEADGTTSEKLDIDSVTISNGAHIDLMNVFMEKVSIALPANINVRLEFIDAYTKKPIENEEREKFIVSFDGSADISKTAQSWKTRGQDIIGASQIAMSIRHDADTVLYQPTTMTFSGASNQYITVEVKPVTYDLTFQFLNVPQYILTSKTNAPVLSLLVEKYDEQNGPAECISVTPVTDFSQLAVLEVPAIRKPQQIRLRMHGYYDEVISLSAADGIDEKGTYRIDVDFALADGHREDGTHQGDDPITGREFRGVVGMLDNKIPAMIVVNMIGLAERDRANIVPNFKPERVEWTYGTMNDMGLANSQGQIQAKMYGCPTYFDMSYTITVFPDNPASSSYLITSGDKPVSIPVPEKDENGQFKELPEIYIDISKIESSSTSN